MRIHQLLARGGLALALGLAGCARRELPVTAATREHTLLVGNGAEPADLDPPAAAAATDINILFALFEGLTGLDEATGRAEPGAAERWEHSPDGLTWTFHLRPSARWSNGDPLVADDFVRSFRRTVNPALAFQNAYYLFPLRHAEAINAGRITDLTQLGCAAPDPHTVVLTLERPTPHLPLLTALSPWFPINPRVLQSFGALTARGPAWTRPGNFVGNGAFALREWRPNARLVVERNPHYWGAPHTQLERIEFYPIEKPDDEERAYRAGQLHVTYTLPLPKLAAWRQRDSAQLRVDPLLYTGFIAFNTTRPPFDDPRIRRALSLAVDRDALVRGPLAGSRPAAYAVTPPGTGGYTARARVAESGDQARALLVAAGHPRGADLPPLELQVRNDEIQPIAAQALQAMWQRELGLRVTIAQLEQKTWLQNQSSGNYGLAFYSWTGDFPDPITFLGLFVSNNGNNWTGWRDPAYDRLIAEAASLSDAGRRTELLQQAEARLLDQLPVTPLFHGAQTYLLRPAVRNWQPALLLNRRYQLIELAAP
jgi:oligopeptide transport system substrate-binding protein